jgi:outer membrane protein
MNSNTFVAGGLAAAIALSSATAAFAQAPVAARPATAAPAPAAAAAISHGPPIPGMCVVSVEGAISNSTVGKYVNTRLQQLVAQVNAELNAEKTAIDTEAKTLDTQRASLQQDVFEQRAAAVQVRAQALQRKAQQRDREIQATEQKAINRVGEEMEPLIRQVYQSQKCAMLVNRQAVVLANPAADITPTVVSALNAKITQFAFDRERLDGPAAAAPAAAAPARPR